MAENSAGKQRGRPFRKGVSGNPAGKPAGTRNRTTLAIQELLEGEADSLTRKCIELALEGDATALRMCMDRLAPPPKDRPIDFAIAAATTAKELSLTLARISEAVGAGTLTPAEANSLASLLDNHRRAIETAELEERIQRLERAAEERSR